MTEFVLYNAPQSTCSQRVRFTLNAKGLDYEEHKLDLFAGDQLKPEYLKINPNGLVPTLLHNGRAVIDSSVIMEYLDEVHPAPRSFLPDDPLQRARMRALIRYIDEVPTPAVRFPSYNLAFLPHFQAMSEEEFMAVCDSKPLRREFLLKLGRTGFSEEVLGEAMERISRGIERLNGQLEDSGGPWLLGDMITEADIAIMPVIVRLNDINLGHLWDGMPAMARWFDAIRADPAFKPTYYSGALLTEKYPHLREKIAS
ncbi:glutathione S-transferase N-terminal domain-containing protein [Breoghania sp. L-A4]|uniref:glutathione S-transferase family protein n=1 Tax=Breoghania sp. L-A4 TaxID=2304600 RepID=UPI000E35B369|nr:glutathione S-transferase N-terminal domain-containing protein [Breoghania sp. L-A4]AXS40372.1 glutathione S-transferase family protein [Breoghania sp. L-A4]